MYPLASPVLMLSTTTAFSVPILSGGAEMCWVTCTVISTLPLRNLRNSGVTDDMWWT